MLTNTSILLSNGANINIVTKKNMTPLMLACKEKLEVMALFLIRKGADLDIRSTEGKSALGYCLQSRMESVAIHLIQKGAPVANWDTVCLHH